METIAKLIMQKIETLGIDLSEISELNEIAKEVLKLNVEIQKLSERRLQLINRGKEIMEKLNDNAKRLMEFIGLINVEEIERAIGKTAKVQTERTERTEKGNGLTGKKIVFNGKMYNIAQYFAQKHGIKGGLSGLEQWAKSQGRTIKVEDDIIYIL
jgi:predicted transcriptional regulator